MFTLLLACAHAFSRNPDFKPDLLYLGALVVDITLLDALAKVLAAG